ncbi:hypothetical protein SAMD00019534_012800 [Acytostelium subglobosum LB1]|uniref:hypothetical protein n=1 Tax=Acytostelium subglobosum LB1 TaxID=1410327 RepID=UPI0006452252|nr:hypothetical protein SAMD00019534_012800 [Acytostelium subglobosum LB1]GAM18105.1 hypothetical protein SAMD00019534_012800 [Acytostelium subglobosum LB1]|eukprot:XP_012758701.1 hypothetical protein SAMD00019534_012800 [Acytostelium subglobosum LB1]
MFNQGGAGSVGKQDVVIKSSSLSLSTSSDQVNLELRIIPNIYHIPGINIYNLKDKQPSYSSNHDIKLSHLLQNTELSYNINKFFYIELHLDGNQSKKYRIYTQFGRTDKISLSQSAVQFRYFEELSEAMEVYSSIYNTKTSEENGYKEVDIILSNSIGSPRKLELCKRVNQVTSHMDEDVERNTQRTYVSKEVAQLVGRLFNFTTRSLKSSLSTVNITENGLETPLGVLSSRQLEESMSTLKSIGQRIVTLSTQINNQSVSTTDKTLLDLCSAYYSKVPTSIGVKAKDKANAVISSLNSYMEQEELHQLMLDLSQVSEKNSGQLVSSSLDDMRYQALHCHIVYLQPYTPEYNIVERLIHNNSYNQDNVHIRNVYRLIKEDEENAFNETIGNEQLMFHGTKCHSLLGVLRRGLQLPDTVVKRNWAFRTDQGFMGAGLYFAKHIEGSLWYTSASSEDSRFVIIARVALGNEHSLHSKDINMTQPPQGFNSCHGVQTTSSKPTPFKHDEYVVYDRTQLKISYVVEFNLSKAYRL